MICSSSRFPGRRDVPLAPRDRHGAGLHVLIAGDAHFQGRDRITPSSRDTAFTVSEIGNRLAAPGGHRLIVRPQPVAMMLRLAAFLLADRMGVIEADQPLAIRSMELRRIVEAVRLLRRYRHSRHDEPHPMAALRVHHEHLAVELEEHIEGRVPRPITTDSYPASAPAAESASAPAANGFFPHPRAAADLLGFDEGG